MSNSTRNAKKTHGIRYLKAHRAWQATWTDLDGKECRRRFPTKTLAVLARESARTKILENRYLDKARIVRTPFRTAVQHFLEHSKTSLSRSSHRDDVRTAKNWLASALFKGKTLDQVTTLDIERYKQLRANDRSRHPANRHASLVSKRLVDYELGRLKRLFNFCIDSELCVHNPVRKVKFFKADVKRIRYLTDVEEQKLFEHIHSRTLARVVQFALNTGMRKGEICGLRWGEVDRCKRIATIPATKAKGKRERHVPLNEAAMKILTDLPENIDRNALVFVNEAGGRLENLQHAWRRAILDAGIEDFRFHDLRHTFASRLVSSGIDLAVIRELLGHQDFKMTLRYAHLTPSKLTDAVAVLDSNRKQSGNTNNQGAAG